MASTDFYGNLGKIIHDILGAGNKIYRDMADVGDHKKRAAKVLEQNGYKVEVR